MNDLTVFFDEAEEGMGSVMRNVPTPIDFSTIRIPISPNARPHDIDCMFSESGRSSVDGAMQRGKHFIFIDVKHGEGMEGAVRRSLRELAANPNHLCLEIECYKIKTRLGHWLFKPHTVRVIAPNEKDDEEFFCEIDAFNDRIDRWYRIPGRESFLKKP